MLQFIKDWQNGKAARLADLKQKAADLALREQTVGTQLANATTADEFVVAMASIEGHFLLDGPCGHKALFKKARDLAGVKEPI